MAPVILETERLRLRPFRLEDHDDLFALLGDAETMRYYPEPFTKEGTLDWIRDSLRRYREDGFGLWALELRVTGELVGDCGPAVREVDGIAEIELGWHVKRAFWGVGLATEAAAACRDWAFLNIRPSRLIALVRPENAQSCRVAEKIGMTVEGEVEYGSMGWLHLVYAIHPPGNGERALAGNREEQKENSADGSTLTWVKGMGGEKYRIGVEHTEPGQWVAYVFDLPGCFDSRSTAAEATARIPEAIQDYFTWRRRHGDSASLPDVVPSEVVDVLDADGRLRTTSLGVVHDVWAFFDDDRRPLNKADVEEILRLLEYSRTDLFASVPPSVTEETGKILLHVGSAEWWYLDRLGLVFPEAELSGDVFHRLDQVRAVTKRVLPGLVGREDIVVKMGETWSPRKLVRRTIWHERDHTGQLVRLLTQ